MKYFGNIARAIAFVSALSAQPTSATVRMDDINGITIPDYPVYATTNYIVRKGDCLIEIAKSHETTLENLLGLNPDLKSRAPEYVIHPGEKFAVSSDIVGTKRITIPIKYKRVELLPI